MIASLASCLTGPLARYADALALPGDHADCIDGVDLLDPETSRGLLQRFGARHPGGDRRAIVSLWTQWHFGVLLIPATAVALVMDRTLPVGLRDVRIAVRDDGRTAAIVLPNDGAVVDAPAQDRFAPLFDGHVAPLIAHVAKSFQVSSRLLWVNAATIFEWTLRQVDPERADAAVMAEAKSLLERRILADGRPNPLFDALRWRQRPGKETALTRKICCLRYRLPGVADCGSLCPLPEATLRRRA